MQAIKQWKYCWYLYFVIIFGLLIVKIYVSLYFERKYEKAFPLITTANVKKQPWLAIPSFTCTLLFLGKKSVAGVENFKLVCLALAAINNFGGDNIKIWNKEVSKL